MITVYFIRSFFSFLCLFCAQALAWNVSKTSLEEKLHNEPPAWVVKRIENDLSFFAQGFSLQDIALCLEKLKTVQGIERAGLVHIHFAESKTHYTPLFPLIYKQTSALKSFLSALHLLDSISPLPNFDFILCIAPSFNRPLLLQHTSVPVFSVSKERHNRKVALIPRLWNSERETLFDRLPTTWDAKTAKGLWRGGATDALYRFYDWDCNPRARLVLHSQHQPDLLDARIVSSPLLEDYILQWMDSLSFFAPSVPPEEQCAYKYLLSRWERFPL